MAGNSGDIKKQLEPFAGAWDKFLEIRETLKLTGKGSPQSRNREALAKTLVWVKDSEIGGGPEDRAAAAASVAVGNPLFVAHMKPAAELAVLDSAPSLDVRWVAANILNEDAKPSDAPSKAAWGVLVWARSEPSEFYKGPYTRLLPSKAQVDGESDQVGDTQLEEDVDFFLEARRLSALRKSAERSPSESGISAGREAGVPVEQVASA
jgi:hypothetical protein